MSQKLTNITTSYHSFAKDQVLTDSQLNEFLNYFDDQDRLTRICLSGVGIVCGFNVSTEHDNSSITITKGAGVTTDGDLIHLLGKNPVMKDATGFVDYIKYTHFREFKGDNVQYRHFNKTNEPSFEQINPIIEIIPEDERTDESPISDLELEKMIVVLYLESYSKTPGACTTVNCENQGIEEVNRLRVLLIPTNLIEHVIRRDDLFNSYNVIENYLAANHIAVPRVIMNQKNSKDLQLLADSYNTKSIEDGIALKMAGGFDQLLSKPEFRRYNEQIQEMLQGIFNIRRSYPILFQYRYDLLKDVVECYNELRDLFLEQKRHCCPDITAFPKHLLLGSASANKQAKKDANFVNKYRHSFHKSPILEDNNDGAERFLFLVNKIVSLLKAYLDLRNFQTEEVKITPSNLRVPLAQKAVPFYYRYRQELFRLWDFDRRKFNEYQYIQGYRHSVNSPIPQVKDPFDFSIDPYNFYRIEGHQGYHYQEALKKVNDLKETYSLPFDVKVLGITINQADALLTDEYMCNFQDLSTLLNAWSAEQKCVLAEVTGVLSSFSTKEPGVNTIEDNYFDFKDTKPPSRSEIVFGKNTIDNPLFEKTRIDDEAELRKTIGFDDNLSQEVTKSKDDIQANRQLTVSGKTKSNPVVDYMNVRPDTVGYYMSLAIKDSFNNASSSIIQRADQLVDKLDTGEWQVDIPKATLSLPMRILAACYAIGELIPSSIKRLNSTTLENYTAEIDKLCSYTKQLQSFYKRQSIVTNISSKTTSIIELLNNQLTNICCSAKKLQALFEEIERRKQDILDRLTFSSFVEKNLGLEHLAGVEPGGTFVMVYVLNKTTSRIPDVSEVPNDDSFVFVRDGIEINRDDLTKDELLKLKEEALLDANRDDFSFTPTKNTPDDALVIRKQERFFNIRSGTVIADFALPYMCCSDCAPINFMIPKIPVSLSLPIDIYCISDEPIEHEFNVSPIDGIIAMEQEVPGVNIINNRLSIDDSFFPDEMIGIPIKFSVNDQETNCQITVRRQPNVDFAVPVSPVDDTTVSFTPVGDLEPGYIYSWDFGDGNTSSEQEPTHTFHPPFDGLFKTAVILTVTPPNGACPRIVQKSIEFTEFDVSITRTEFCENDPIFEFNIAPDGSPDIQGIGVTPDKKGFDPSIGPDGSPYDITLYGNVIASMTVHAAISAGQIKYRIGSNELRVGINSDHVDTYTWSFIYNELNVIQPVQSTDNKLTVSMSSFDEIASGEEVLIRVHMTNSGTCDSVTREIKFTIPDRVTPTISLTPDTLCSNDRGNHPFTLLNFSAQPVLSGADPGIDNKSTPPTFNAQQAGAGTYTITAPGAAPITVIVTDPPTADMTVTISQDGATFSLLALTSGVIGELRWSFENANTGAQLIPDIVDDTNPTVSYSSLGTGWKAVKVTLSVKSDPCNEVSVSETISRPQNVQVDIQPKIYCIKDKRNLPFNITPSEATPTIEINGAVVGNSFVPSSLPSGDNQVIVNGSPAFTLNIVKGQVVASIAGSPPNKKGQLTLNANVTEDHNAPYSVEWKLYKNNNFEVAITEEQGETFSKSLIALGYVPGDTVNVVMSVSNVCGTNELSGSFAIPKQSNDNVIIVNPGDTGGNHTSSCHSISDAFLQQDNSTLANIIKTEAGIITATQLATLNSLKTLLTDTINSLDDSLTGKFNSNVIPMLDTILKDLKAAILRSQNSDLSNRVNVLSAVYEIAFRTYLNIIRCQDPAALESLEINTISQLLEGHFDPTNKNSFVAKQIKIDANNDLKAFIEDVLNQKNTLVIPWSSIEIVMASL